MARSGVATDVETLRRGMMLTEREKFTNDYSRKYLKGDEFLMVNPDKKPKKVSKRRESIIRRGGKSTAKKSGSK